MMQIRFIFLVFLCCTSVQAQTLVSGTITTTTWDTTGSPYLVVGDILVPSGQYLTIMAGVNVWFGYGMDTTKYRITIEGGMNAWGTEDDSVEFAYIYGTLPDKWQYIEYDGASSDSATLNYCKIESGDRAVKVTDCQVTLNHCLIQSHNDIPIRGQNANINLNNCIITNNNGSGILLSNTTANLVNCEITYCSGTDGRGIDATGGGMLSVEGGYIGHNTGYGIKGWSIDGILLSQVEIAQNHLAGVHLTLSGALSASRLLIHNNESHGIFLSTTSADANNLTISSNGGHGIFTNSSLELTSSIIDRNAQSGIYCQSGSPSPSLGYNDAYQNDEGNYSGCTPGEGSIEEDPLYVSLPGMDFNLQDTSLCIDAGDPLDPLDPDGTRTDMGALYYDQNPVQPWFDPQRVSEFRIVAAYPNPFNPVLNITIQADRPVLGSIEAWTVQGRLAARIWEGRLNPGLNELIWTAGPLASGSYYLRLRAAHISDILPCTLLK